MAVPFDLELLEVTGSPLPVLEGLITSHDTGAAQFTLSRDGTLFFISGDAGSDYNKLVWVDRKGRAQPFPLAPRIFYSAHPSPDGSRVVMDLGAANGDVWLFELGRGTLSRFTLEWESYNPIWMPDSTRVTYVHSEGLTNSLILKPADGSGPAEELVASEHLLSPTSWSPDGTLLAYTQIDPTTRADIWLLPLEGQRKPRAFLKTHFHEFDAVFSPDGKWLAYASDETGRNDVYVRPRTGPGGKLKISTEGGMEPQWSSSGREIFYRNGDKMMTVEVQTGAAFNMGKPRVLFEGRFLRPLGFPYPSYDVTPDGQQFLMTKEGEKHSAPSQISVVLNWFDELNRLVPTESD